MRRLAAWSLLVAVALLLAACASSDSASPSPQASVVPASEPPAEAGGSSTRLAAEPGSRLFRIVTIGDVYTYGTGTDAPRRDSWPAQMRTALQHRGGMRIRLDNLADNSSPTVEVIDSQLAEVESLEPDVVIVQVGVDDLVGGETESYGQNIAYILGELRRILPADRIFAVTTPDHTLTEWGRAGANRGTHEEVEALNEDLRAAAAGLGITVIDIGPVNERVVVDESLLVQASPPRPYPTAKQYAAWAEIIGLHVREALETLEP